MANEILYIAIALVLTLLALTGVMASLYRKAGPHEALIVYGFRGTRIIKGRATVIFPMIENFRQLSLELMSFDVAPQQDLYTKQGVAVTVEAVAQIKVKSDPESIQTAAVKLLNKNGRCTRRADPLGDGRAPSRHYRPTLGRANCKRARDGRRSDASHVRRGHD